jgi:hypothetical protein
MKKIILPLLAISLLTGCKKDKEEETVVAATEEAADETADDDATTTKYEVPKTYDFGESVSYSGQTDRLNMLSALKKEVEKSHTEGTSVSAKTLKDMFDNKDKDGSAFEGEGLGATGKNLSGKTEGLAKDDMYLILDEIASYSGQLSSGNSAGLVERAGKGLILVNAKGQEYAQLVEKGLMGSCFYNQIVNSYLSDGKIGKDVENVAKDKDDDGNDKKYTKKQHHFDEAFGYFGVPTNWDKASNGSFWGKYCNKRNTDLGTNSIFDDFLKGRAAIDNNVHDDQITPVKDIISKIEKVAAGTAIAYLNESKTLSGGAQKHALTEALCFLRACKYGNSDAKVTPADVTDIEAALNNGNFWDISNDHINAAIDKLAAASGLSKDLK